jgi:hypothetical protein
MSLTANEYKRQFLASEEAVTIKQQLRLMVDDPRYNTQSFYTSMQDEDISFVEKHIAYLSEHPKIKTSEYLSNLRLRTKLRK